MTLMLFKDRARAESFGAIAQIYDRARPSYPAALVDVLLTDGAQRVLDVGCGTGIASALFAERGCAVLGVEIDARMAPLARAKGLAVEVARFENWEPRGRLFDLVISAQAWHWIEPGAGIAKAAVVLVDRGRIGVFWNFGDPPPGIRDLLAPIYTRLAPGLENYSVLLGNQQHTRAEAVVPAITASGHFELAGSRTFGWTQTYDTSGWLEHLATHSDHQALPPKQRERLFAAVGEAIDSLGGSFDMPYRTVLVTARRRQRSR